MEYTGEQKRILSTEPLEEYLLKIRAFAGTGKTTMLREYAKARPEQPFVYLAFNKALRVEAMSTMPPNVDSRTVHSLAYASIGVHYKEKSLLAGGGIKVGDVMRLHRGIDFKTAHAVCRTMEVYFASADSEIGEMHIPKGINDGILGGDKIEKAAEEGGGEKLAIAIRATQRRREKVVSLATDTWGAMRSFKDRKMGMTHDGYLKMYQVSGRGRRRGVILIDEVQDMTPCMWAAIGNQGGRQVIVGDQYQALYGWRGAVDFLTRTRTIPELDLCLTQSFRFGNKVASLATSLLANTMGEAQTLKGNPDVDTEVLALGDKGCPKRGIVLCRSNSEIFRSALASSKYTKVGILGGSEGCRLQDMADIQYLMAQDWDKIRSGLVRSFGTFEQLKHYADVVGEIGLIGSCEMVEKHGDGIHEMIDAVRNSEVPMTRAGIRFSTVHKAKGLEWPVVCIGRDLERGLLAATLGDKCELSEDFVNIIYVALTRGVKKILCPQIVLDYARGGDAFLAKARRRSA